MWERVGKDQKRKAAGNAKDKKKRILFLAGGILGCLVLGGILTVWLLAGKHTESKKAGEGKPYHAHYVLIAESMEDRQWETLYQEMKEQGAASGIYVECLNRTFPQEYTREDYLKIAVSMQVDGIILEGEDDQKLNGLVDQAVDRKIPVITLMTDCEGSKRQCFIEMGKYNLGREYARQIIETVTKDTQKVLVLVHSVKKDNSQNLILGGIRDTLKNEGNHLNLELETQVVENSEFDSAQMIRQRILSGSDIPDILICLNDQDTTSVYQVLADYNMLKTVKLIGTSTEDLILNGIRKGSVLSVIQPDAAQAGRKCLEALENYRENGHVSDYMALDAKVIHEENVKEYLADETAK